MGLQWTGLCSSLGSRLVLVNQTVKSKSLGTLCLGAFVFRSGRASDTTRAFSLLRKLATSERLIADEIHRLVEITNIISGST